MVDHQRPLLRLLLSMRSTPPEMVDEDWTMAIEESLQALSKHILDENDPVTVRLLYVFLKDLNDFQVGIRASLGEMRAALSDTIKEKRAELRITPQESIGVPHGDGSS